MKNLCQNTIKSMPFEAVCYLDNKYFYVDYLFKNSKKNNDNQDIFFLLKEKP